MIPDYESMMLPILRFLANRKERTTSDVYKLIFNEFDVTEEEKNQRQPSGMDFVVKNRIRWAVLYLKKAGLISSKKRGNYEITSSGLKLLEKNIDKIDSKVLEEFEAFKDFKYKVDRVEQHPTIRFWVNPTPDERMEGAYSEVTKALGDELMVRVMSMSPAFFETLVLRLLQAMGYGQGNVTGRSSDGGIDGYIHQDALGLDKIFFQAKRWKNTVPASELRDFVGSLDVRGVTKGVFITTSGFPKEEEKMIGRSQKSIVLIDGIRLLDLMIDYGVGVSTSKEYLIKRVDSDFFDEG